MSVCVWCCFLLWFCIFSIFWHGWVAESCVELCHTPDLPKDAVLPQNVPGTNEGGARIRRCLCDDGTLQLWVSAWHRPILELSEHAVVYLVPCEWLFRSAADLFPLATTAASVPGQDLYQRARE